MGTGDWGDALVLSPRVCVVAPAAAAFSRRFASFQSLLSMTHPAPRLDKRVNPSVPEPEGGEKATHPPSPGRTCHQRTPPTTRRVSLSPSRAHTSTRVASYTHDCGTGRRTTMVEGPAGACRFAYCWSCSTVWIHSQLS